MARDGFQLPDDAVPGRETCCSRSCTHSHDQVVTRSMMIMMDMMGMRISTGSDIQHMITRHIEQTVAYTRERKAFGAPLLDNQYIHFRLAELLTEVTVVHMLCAKLKRNHFPLILQFLRWICILGWDVEITFVQGHRPLRGWTVSANWLELVNIVSIFQ